MGFDPAKEFSVISDFDESKPFKVISVFDPSQPFEVVKKSLKTLEKAFVEPVKPELTKKEVLSIVKEAIDALPKPKPKVIEKIIEKEIIKEVKTVEKKEEKKDNKLEKEIESLKSQLERIQSFLLLQGGSGVIGIPNPQGNEGKYISSVKGQAVWAAVSSGSSNANPTYIGDPTTEGSWRFRDDGTDLLHERLESGVWVEKGRDLA